MYLSMGWIFFGGGIAGLIAACRSDFSFWNRDSAVGNPETDKKPVSSKMRLLAILINLLLIVLGALVIQRQHNWNPFQKCPACKLDDGAVS